MGILQSFLPSATTTYPKRHESKEEKLKKVEEKYLLEKEGITCPCCLNVKYSKNKISTFLDQLKSLKIHPVSYQEDKSIYFEYAKEYKTEKDYLEIK